MKQQVYQEKSDNMHKGIKTIDKNLQLLAKAYNLSINEFRSMGNARATSGSYLDEINEIIIKEASKGKDGYFFINIDKLQYLCDSFDIPFDSIMNSNLASLTNNPSLTLSSLLNTNYGLHTPAKFHIVVPYLDEILNVSPQSNGQILFSSSDINAIKNNIPLVGYNILNDQYPIRGFSNVSNGTLNSEYDITKPLASSEYANIFAYTTVSECIIDGTFCLDHINLCHGQFSECDNCNTYPMDFASGDICPEPSSTITTYEIILTFNNTAFLNSNCNELEGFYKLATLHSYPDVFRYYDRTYWGSEDPGYRTVKKTATPLHARATIPILNDLGYTSGIQGKSLTLCDPIIKMNTTDEPGAHYGIAFGGVYMLENSMNPPVYFYIPVKGKLYFYDGPDMIINYHSYDDGAICTNGKHSVAPCIKLALCNFCGTMPLSFGYGNDNYFCTFDPSIISSYWNANTLDLCIAHPSFQCRPANTFQLHTSDNNSIADSSYGDLLCSATVTTDGKFQIQATFTDWKNSGDNIIIDVYMQFDDGAVIDHAFVHTLPLSDLGTVLQYRELNLELHGKVSHYNINIYESL